MPMQPHSLLMQQKRAADRAAHCHFLARLRIMQGYLGAALFYQHEAARMHRRTCKLREQWIAEQQADIVTDPISGHTFRITRYVPPANSVNIGRKIA